MKIRDHVTIINLDGFLDEDKSESRRFLGESGVVGIIVKDKEDSSLDEYLVEFENDVGDWFFKKNLKLVK